MHSVYVNNMLVNDHAMNTINQLTRYLKDN